jgi:hypothetical protein
MIKTNDFRWRVTDEYIPSLDDFKKVLMQRCKDDQGNDIWIEVPTI